MIKVRQVGDALWFWCPGCNERHKVRISGDGAWWWNGSLDAPSFAPSVLVRSGHYLDEKSCWCRYNEAHPDKPAPFSCLHCHSYVTNGNIRFLADCSHALANQTVSLPDWRDEPIRAGADA